MEQHHIEFTEGHCERHASTACPPYPSKAFENVKVFLASNSPRRRELLSMILPEFEIAAGREVDESYPAELAPAEVPAFLSRVKSDAYADDMEAGSLLITADTVVISEGAILGKPKSPEEACEMLLSLAGRRHTVVTGVTLRSSDGRVLTFSESTEVCFGELSRAEIECYVERYRPLDKAGAYGIQEWIGAAAIAGIDGCFYNVMGLPLHALYRRLREFY